MGVLLGGPPRSEIYCFSSLVFSCCGAGRRVMWLARV